MTIIRHCTDAFQRLSFGGIFLGGLILRGPYTHGNESIRENVKIKRFWYVYKMKDFIFPFNTTWNYSAADKQYFKDVTTDTISLLVFQTVKH